MTYWAKVQFRFEGLHRYPGAPDGVQFLENLHRHEFHVVVFVEQFHEERDVEYILLKRRLQQAFGLTRFPTVYSCEAMAAKIATFVLQECGAGRRIKVEVTEDGENGALVEL